MTSRECENCLSDVLSGKTGGLQQIYESYYSAVFALSLSILNDYHKAEDVAQEVFLKIWSGADSYKFSSNPKAWIMGITRNLSIDFLRKSKHEMPDEAVGDIGNDGNACIDDLVTSRMELEQALQHLPDIERQIFVMHFAGDISYLFISRILKIPLATVAWKCSHGVKAMQKVLIK